MPCVSFEGDFYPLRTTVSRAIQDHKTSIVVRHPHPGPFAQSESRPACCSLADSLLRIAHTCAGYGVSYPDSAMTHPEESYDVMSPLHASHRAIRADFARGMREAKICVVRRSTPICSGNHRLTHTLPLLPAVQFDSSVERKMIRKSVTPIGLLFCQLPRR